MASLPYPRSHQTILPQNSRNTETTDGEYPPTDCTEVSGARYSSTDCTDMHRLGGYGIPAIPTQPPNYPPTEFTEHRNDRWGISSHRLHRSFWRKIFFHGLHGYAQIRRVWHPCHTHAATKLSFHRIRGTHRNDWRRRKICVHL